MAQFLSKLTIAFALGLGVGGVFAQESGVQQAGTEVREERNVSMSETAYKRLTQIHEFMGKGNWTRHLSALVASRIPACRPTKTRW